MEKTQREKKDEEREEVFKAGGEIIGTTLL